MPAARNSSSIDASRSSVCASTIAVLSRAVASAQIVAGAAGVQSRRAPVAWGSGDVGMGHASPAWKVLVPGRCAATMPLGQTSCSPMKAQFLRGCHGSSPAAVFNALRAEAAARSAAFAAAAQELGVTAGRSASRLLRERQPMIFRTRLKIKQERYERVMEVQQEISAAKKAYWSDHDCIGG